MKCVFMDGWYNQGNMVKTIWLKTKKCFLKVVQGYSLSLTATVVVLPIRIMRLQSLRFYFGRVSVGKRSILGHWGFSLYL